MASEVVKVADGHDSAGSLAAFDVDPLVRRIVAGVRRISLSGTVHEDGQPSARAEWGPKVPNSVKTAVLTACGLTDAAITNEVTVRLPDDDDYTSWSNYNALAYRPDDDGYERGGWSGFAVMFLFLEAI